MELLFKDNKSTFNVFNDFIPHIILFPLNYRAISYTSSNFNF